MPPLIDCGEQTQEQRDLRRLILTRHAFVTSPSGYRQRCSYDRHPSPMRYVPRGTDSFNRKRLAKRCDGLRHRKTSAVTTFTVYKESYYRRYEIVAKGEPMSDDSLTASGVSRSEFLRRAGALGIAGAATLGFPLLETRMAGAAPLVVPHATSSPRAAARRSRSVHIDGFSGVYAAASESQQSGLQLAIDGSEQEELAHQI